MEYVFAALSVWLIFIGSIMTTRNIESVVFYKVPCFVFGMFVGLYSLNMFGLLSFTI